MKGIALIGTIGALALTAPVTAAAVRVLILSGQNNHRWQETTPRIRQICESAGFKVAVTNTPQTLTAGDLSSCDVIISNWNGWGKAKITQWPKATRTAVLAFVRNGGGWVTVHAGSSSFYDWPEYHKMTGATWKLGQTGHGPRHEFEVKVADGEHPITKGLGSFQIFDELWNRPGVQPDMKVLATAFSATDKRGTGNDEPVLMVHNYGKGRVVAFTLGHNAQAMTNANWATILTRSTEWAATGSVSSKKGVAVAAGFHWKKNDSSVALMNNDAVVWQFNHHSKHGKPFFHPLALTDGTVLSVDGPRDHPWHHGLWFCWKYINGLNYWEENRKTGLAEGTTEVADIAVNTTDSYAAEIKLTLSYHPPAKPEVMSEKRTVRVSAPEKDGSYCIDWIAVFKATGGDVELNRTPIKGQPGGKSWGGYAGMSIRMAKSMCDWTFTNHEGATGAELINRDSVWVHSAGKTPTGRDAGLTIMDHPSNLRHPSPWYLVPRMPYFSPAVIYRKPFVLKKNDSFTLRYRVWVHSGAVDNGELNRKWKSFSKAK